MPITQEEGINHLIALAIIAGILIICLAIYVCYLNFDWRNAFRSRTQVRA